MATKKYLSLERLTEYDALIKAKIAEDDSSTLSSANEYTDEAIAAIEISDISVSATQTKASTEYTEEDAEIWIFNCGTSTVLV